MDYNITYREKDKGLQVIVSYKDSNGKWRQKSKQGFENSRIGKRKAKEAANRIVEDLTKTSKILNDMHDLTLGELQDEFLEHIELHRTVSTYSSYSNALSRFNKINNVLVRELEIHDVQKCVDDLVNILSTTTTKTYLSIFSTMLKFAYVQYNIPLLNLSRITMPKHSKKSNSAQTALTVAEQQKALNFYKENCDKKLDYYIIVLIALKAGLRIGEIMGLTWQDIDFQKGTINVDKQWKLLNTKSSDYGFAELKSNNSYRVVPISQDTLKELSYIKSIAPINSYQRIVGKPNTNYTTSCIARHLKRHCGITIHTLRHTYATNLISHGVDFKTAAHLLGHDIEQTMKTYSHVTDDMLKHANDVIHNFL